MKNEISDTLEFIGSMIKSYGILIGLIMLIYYSIKKSWFWIIMPILAFKALQQIALIINIGWASKITTIGVIVCWLFIFSFLKLIFNGLCEKKK